MGSACQQSTSAPSHQIPTPPAWIAGLMPRLMRAPDPEQASAITICVLARSGTRRALQRPKLRFEPAPKRRGGLQSGLWGWMRGSMLHATAAKTRVGPHSRVGPPAHDFFPPALRGCVSASQLHSVPAPQPPRIQVGRLAVARFEARTRHKRCGPGRPGMWLWVQDLVKTAQSSKMSKRSVFTWAAVSD